MDFGLEGRIALVLAASRGLGFAVAKTLAREGARVILAGRNEALLEEAAAGIRAAGGHAGIQPLDLADRTSVPAAVSGVPQPSMRSRSASIIALAQPHPGSATRNSSSPNRPSTS